MSPRQRGEEPAVERFLDWLDETGLSIVPAIVVLVGLPLFLVLVFSSVIGARP